MSDYIKREDVIKAFERVLDEDFPYISEETPRERIAAIPPADVVEGVACKECRFRDVCQQEIKMLGPGIVYEYSLKIEGCSLGERMVRTNE